VKIAKPPNSPVRDETALTVALCLTFRLPRSQGHALMKLVTQEFVRKDEISATATQNNSAAGVMICKLRKNLLSHRVEIATLRKLGYALHRGSREKVFRQLAKYDAGRIPTIPPVQHQPSV
jgi:hypothetical protein